MLRIRRLIATRLASVVACMLLMSAGCSVSRWSDTARTATEQLLLSDAIEQAVNRLNFSALNGHEVYFESKYLNGCVDESYVISSLRQHLLASGCILREKIEDAEYVVEARAGAVGTDRKDLSFGAPSVSVPAVVPGVPVAAPIPEVTLAKKTKQRGVAKLAVYAYNRHTGRPVWQSGVQQVTSQAGETWVLGAGAYRAGEIYEEGKKKPKRRGHVAPSRSVETGPPSQIDSTAEMFFSDKIDLDLESDQKKVNPPTAQDPVASNNPAALPVPASAEPEADSIARSQTPGRFFQASNSTETDPPESKSDTNQASSWGWLSVFTPSYWTGD